MPSTELEMGIEEAKMEFAFHRGGFASPLTNEWGRLEFLMALIIVLRASAVTNISASLFHNLYIDCDAVQISPFLLSTHTTATPAAMRLRPTMLVKGLPHRHWMIDETCSLQDTQG